MEERHCFVSPCWYGARTVIELWQVWTAENIMQMLGTGPEVQRQRTSVFNVVLLILQGEMRIDPATRGWNHSVDGVRTWRRARRIGRQMISNGCLQWTFATVPSASCLMFLLWCVGWKTLLENCCRNYYRSISNQGKTWTMLNERRSNEPLIWHLAWC